MSDSDGCCRCCTSFILTSGLAVFFLWLSLRASLPTCYIQQFYVPALNKTISGNISLTPKNTTVFFQIKLANNNREKGIYYDSLNFTIYYLSNITRRRLPVANASSPAIYRGGNKKFQSTQLVDTHGVPWDEAINGSGVVFRVGLQTAVRFKIAFFKTKRHRLDVGADVELNDMGSKVHKKDIKLSSSSPPYLRRDWFPILVTVISVYIALFYVI